MAATADVEGLVASPLNIEDYSLVSRLGLTPSSMPERDAISIDCTDETDGESYERSQIFEGLLTSLLAPRTCGLRWPPSGGHGGRAVDLQAAWCYLQ